MAAESTLLPEVKRRYLGCFSFLLIFILLTAKAQAQKFHAGGWQHQQQLLSCCPACAGMQKSHDVSGVPGPLKPAGIAKSCQYTVCPAGPPGSKGGCVCHKCAEQQLSQRQNRLFCQQALCSGRKLGGSLQNIGPARIPDATCH
jgi:hypothetical protein